MKWFAVSGPSKFSVLSFIAFLFTVWLGGRSDSSALYAFIKTVIVSALCWFSLGTLELVIASYIKDKEEKQ